MRVSKPRQSNFLTKKDMNFSTLKTKLCYSTERAAKAIVGAFQRARSGPDALPVPLPPSQLCLLTLNCNKLCLLIPPKAHCRDYRTPPKPDQESAPEERSQQFTQQPQSSLRRHWAPRLWTRPLFTSWTFKVIKNILIQTHMLTELFPTLPQYCVQAFRTALKD